MHRANKSAQIYDHVKIAMQSVQKAITIYRFDKYFVHRQFRMEFLHNQIEKFRTVSKIIQDLFVTKKALSSAACDLSDEHTLR